MRNVREMIADYCHNENYELYGDYSGRRMYGRTCPGIVCPDPIEALLGLVDYIVDKGLDGQTSVTELIGIPRTDNMGTDMILYFPMLTTDC